MNLLGVLSVVATGDPVAEPLSRLVEVGLSILDLDSQVIVEVWEGVANPGALHWKGAAFSEALQGAGLEPSYIDSAPPSYVVAPELRVFLVSRGVRALTAFNVSHAFHPLLLGSGLWLGPLAGGIRLGPCLQDEARRAIYGASASSSTPVSLQAALAYFGVAPLLPFHRAANDAQNAAVLCRRLLNHGVGPAKEGLRDRLNHFNSWGPEGRRDSARLPLRGAPSLSGAFLPLTQVGAKGPNRS